jgi:hypothetical protein
MCVAGLLAPPANRTLTSGYPRLGKRPTCFCASSRQLAAGQAIVQRIVLLGRQPARDIAHDRNYLLHDITAVSAGGTSQ